MKEKKRTTWIHTLLCTFSLHSIRISKWATENFDFFFCWVLFCFSSEVEPISTFLEFGEQEYLVADERGYEYILYKMAETFLFSSEGKILDSRLKLNKVNRKFLYFDFALLLLSVFLCFGFFILKWFVGFAFVVLFLCLKWINHQIKTKGKDIIISNWIEKRNREKYAKNPKLCFVCMHSFLMLLLRLNWLTHPCGVLGLVW